MSVCVGGVGATLSFSSRVFTSVFRFVVLVERLCVLLCVGNRVCVRSCVFTLFFLRFGARVHVLSAEEQHTCSSLAARCFFFHVTCHIVVVPCL